MLHQLSRTILSVGVQPEHTRGDRQRLITLNATCSLAASMSLIAALVTLLTQQWGVLPGTIAFFLSCLLVLDIQRRGHSYLSALLFSFLCLGIIWGQHLYLGPSVGVYYWLMPLMLFPFFIFTHQARWTPLIMGSLSWLSFLRLFGLQAEELDISSEATGTMALSSLFILLVGSILRSLLSAEQALAVRAEEALLTQAEQVSELNEQLQVSLMRVRDVSRMKDDFLASLNHELRTPLNAIMGLSEVLQEGVYGAMSEGQVQAARTIHSSGERLLHMVEDIVEFARIGAGKVQPQLESNSLGDLTKALQWTFQGEIEERGLSLQMEQQGADTKVLTDLKLAQRMLGKLLANAIKFTPPGEAIGMQVEPSPQGMELSIWDRGPGIPLEKLDTLFEPFTQGDSGLARKHGGTGLGLALAGRIAGLLGVRLGVQSQPGRGSRFQVSFPQDPRQLVFYGNLSCPRSYQCQHWLDEAQLSHLVVWRLVPLASSYPDAASLEAARKEAEGNLLPITLRRSTLDPDLTDQLHGLLGWLQEEHASQTPSLRSALFQICWGEGDATRIREQVRDLLQRSFIEAQLDSFSVSPGSEEATPSGSLVRLKDQECLTAPRSSDMLRGFVEEAQGRMSYVLPPPAEPGEDSSGR